MVRLLALLTALAAVSPGQGLEKALRLYRQTDYASALQTLQQSSGIPPAEGDLLAGQCHYMMGDFRRAVDYFEKAVAADPSRATSHHWLGRAWGRRAETSGPFTAPVYAARARQAFEKAVELDPRDAEAVNDLFSYYLDAPGFLGGGLDKAQALIPKIQASDPAEVHYALAQIAMKRKQYDAAEGQLRKAVELAPRKVGRLVDLAKFLATRGKYQESEAAFEAAARINPKDPGLLFERASTYIRGKRNLLQARTLLETYLQQPPAPFMPTREEAEKLLRSVSGG